MIPERKSAYNVAIVGATGAVGQTLLEVLAERNFPIDNLKLLASSRSSGKKISYNKKDYIVEELNHNSFENIDIAFFSAGASISKEFIPSAVRSEAVVIDNSSAYRMDETVPLVVPEVNPEDALNNNGIIANPNCTTIIMLVPLKPLHDYANIKRIVVSSYQAASGAGATAAKELLDQTEAWAKDGSIVEAKAFPYQLLFNVIPQIDVFTENGYTKEEMKMYNETRKILHSDSIKVSATCVRVPVLTAHSESILIETEKKLTPVKARELLSNASGVKLCDNPEKKEYPMPLLTSDQDLCYVGRIREDIAYENGLSLFVSGDQLRKGAATNAIQIGEILISK